MAAGAGAALAALAVAGTPLLAVPGIGLKLATQTTAATPTGLAIAAIPPAYLALYEQAAATCPGLSWTILAGIGEVETDHGRVTADGVTSGANDAGAEGPMQMQPANFALYGNPVPADHAPTPPSGAVPRSPYDPVDEVFAAARMLCADNVVADLRGALYDYNHAGWYVDDVLSWAARYGRLATGAATPAALLAVQYALSVVGTPYVWGGDSPSGGFDCSGLAQWAYAEAGVSLPRVAQAQHDQLSGLEPGQPLAAGDLVFFGTDPTHVEHVGIYVGDGMMVDAPHTGAQVRIEAVEGFSPPYLGGSTLSP